MGEEAGLLLRAPPPGWAVFAGAALTLRATAGPLLLLAGVVCPPAAPLLQPLLCGEPVEAVCLLASWAQPGRQAGARPAHQRV